jgi:steroid 5-alpha reductase family enzyme
VTLIVNKDRSATIQSLMTFLIHKTINEKKCKTMYFSTTSNPMGTALSSISFNSVVAVDFGIQAAAFAIAAPLQTEKFYDIAGSLTYGACVVTSLMAGRMGLLKKVGISKFITGLHPRQLMVSTTTLLWCTRLGCYLAYRVLQDGKDSRFDKLKTQPLRFSFAWFMQGVWVLATAFPVYAINLSLASRLSPIGLLDYFGLGVWGLGFLFEVVSDCQKLMWQKRIGGEERKKQFINEGFWSISRHPNYFGEVTLWVGSFIICASGFRHLGIVGLKTAGLFAISPLFVTALLMKLSGVPMLEKASDKRFGHLESYQQYKKDVPVFFPRFALKEKTE